MTDYLNIAVQGCCHGELDKIYDTIRDAEAKGQKKIELLIICGDFECIRDIIDLECVAVPPKYRKLNTFHHYLSGQKIAPVTTVFIGGNHEASNVLQSLYYGGWVAPNIYFLGFAGVIWYKGIRIAGLSGIFNSRHYHLGHYESPPYNNDTLRSVYHLRELEVHRMAHVSGRVDVFLSHDWPAGIEEFGDKGKLLRQKKFLAEDIDKGELGSPPLMQLMKLLQPSFWFAAHLHVKFAAIYPHIMDCHSHSTQSRAHSLSPGPGSASAAVGTQTGPYAAPPGPHFDPATDLLPTPPLPPSTNPVPVPVPVTAVGPTAGPRLTRFLSLDKVLPGRDFLQFLQVPIPIPSRGSADAGLTHAAAAAPEAAISLDVQWLAVLRRTHSLLSTSAGRVHVPQSVAPITQEEIAWMEARLLSQWGSARPPAFVPLCLPARPAAISGRPAPLPSPATDALLDLLMRPHVWTVPVSAVNAPPPASPPAPAVPTPHSSHPAPPPPPPRPPAPGGRGRGLSNLPAWLTDGASGGTGAGDGGSRVCQEDATGTGTGAVTAGRFDDPDGDGDGEARSFPGGPYWSKRGRLELHSVPLAGRVRDANEISISDEEDKEEEGGGGGSVCVGKYSSGRVVDGSRSLQSTAVSWAEDRGSSSSGGPPPPPFPVRRALVLPPPKHDDCFGTECAGSSAGGGNSAGGGSSASVSRGVGDGVKGDSNAIDIDSLL